MDQIELSRALEFSSEDLKANRDGYMTKEQRKKLRNKGRRTAAMVGFYPGFALLLFIDQTILSRLNYSSELIHALANFSEFFIAAIVWIILARAIIYQHFKTDLYKGKAEYIGGRVHLFSENRGRRKFNYRLIISNQIFAISEKISAAFDDGEFYGVYYAPKTKTILSAEKLG